MDFSVGLYDCLQGNLDLNKSIYMTRSSPYWPKLRHCSC